MGGKSRLLSTWFAKGKVNYYDSGETILHPDDKPSGIFYIKKGYVKISSITVQGDEKLHIIYKAGEIFPWIWVFQDVVKPVYYEALGGVVLNKVVKEDFLKFLKTACQTTDECSLLFELTEQITSILDVHIDRVDNLELTKAYPRLVSRLLSLAKRFGKKKQDRIIIEVPITHRDIANSINMTRETASREIEKLIKKGLLKSNKQHLLVITDVNKLNQELEKHYERKLL